MVKRAKNILTGSTTAKLFSLFFTTLQLKVDIFSLLLHIAKFIIHQTKSLMIKVFVLSSIFFAKFSSENISYKIVNNNISI